MKISPVSRTQNARRFGIFFLSILTAATTVYPGRSWSQETANKAGSDIGEVLAGELWSPPPVVRSTPPMPPRVPETSGRIDLDFGRAEDADAARIEAAKVLNLPVIRAKEEAISTAEMRSAATALSGYQKSGGGETAGGRASLENFLQEHPEGGYAPSIELELASAYWRTGFWEKSLNKLEAAWTGVSKSGEAEVKIRRLADVILSELLMKSALLGRKERLRTILAQVADRQSGGDATNALHRAKELLWFLDNRAEQNIQCGFSAANLVCVPRGQNAIVPDVHDEEEKKKFIAEGISLWDIAEHSAESKGNLRCVFRSDPEAPMAVPSVIHWKFGHFSAVTEKSEDGSVHLKDSQLKFNSWVAPSVFKEAGSGYALLPSDVELPAGYRRVPEAEARQVFGRHCMHGFDDEGCDPETGLCGGGSKGMATYTLNLRRAYHNVLDTPVGYSMPDGMTMDFTLKHCHMPSVLSGINSTYGFGPNWFPVFGGGSIVLKGTGSPNSMIEWQTGTGTYNIFDLVGSTYTGKLAELPAVSYLSAPSGPGYRLSFTDGSYFDYTTAVTSPDSRYLLTRKVNSVGSTITFGYDLNARLMSVTDMWGGTTVFSYVPEPGDPAPEVSYPSLIRRITDPFGRYAKFFYGSDGRLATITDAIGLVSEITYFGAFDTIYKIKTPYGETRFDYDVSGLIVTDPRGFKERITQIGGTASAPLRVLAANGTVISGAPEDYTVRDWGGNWTGDPYEDDYQDATALAPNSVNSVSFYPKNDHIQWRNTWYWDKKAMYHGPENWNLATVYNWKSDAWQYNIVPALASSRSPGQGRVWFNYPGQTGVDGSISSYQPAKTVRQVENEAGIPTWAMTQQTYNEHGLPLESVDEKGRKTKIVYAANNQDVSTVQTWINGAWVTLKSFIYAPAPNTRLPATITEVSGLTTGYLYNASGQVTQVTTSKASNSEAVRYTYSAHPTTAPAAWPGAPGFLRKIEKTSPANPVLWVSTDEFTYDSTNRVRTHLDAGNYQTTCDYDNFDRLTLVTHPDGSTQQFAYQYLDLAATKDRAGRWSRTAYNEVRQPVAQLSPDGKITQYDWCLCGQLQKLTDAAGRETKWTWAPGGYLQEKLLPDGVTKTTYTYEPNSGRLATITQPNDQGGANPTVTYRYDVDARRRTINYTDPGTPDLTFTYESNNLGRLTTVADGIGAHNYVYIPLTSGTAGAGQLDYVNGPLTDDRFRNVYDWQNRVGTLDLLQDTLVSPANLRTESYAWDSLRRPASVVNTLGTYTVGYSTLLNRPDTLSGPFGISSAFTYNGNTAPGHSAGALTGITYTLGAAQLAKHTYGTDKGGRITSWQQESNGLASTITKYDYSLDDELLVAEDRTLSSSALIDRETWGLDKAGNWLSHSRSATSLMETRTHDSLNRLNQIGGAGSTLVEGTVNENATVTVNNQLAELRADPVAGGYRYRKIVAVTAGSNTVQIKAVDKDTPPKTTQQNWQFSVPAIQRSFSYDENGNTLSDGLRTYTWDAKNRLKTVTQGGDTWKWDYDYLDRRVKEYHYAAGGSSATPSKILIWCGNTLVQERNASNTVTRTHYEGGFSDGATATSGAKYRTLADHLGNVREIIDSSGSTAAVYDYTTLQGPVKVSGSLDATKLTIGEYYHHAATGLELALYRAYDSVLGRWLSRDPIEEIGGLNLYSYLRNSPISFLDLFGDAPQKYDNSCVANATQEAIRRATGKLIPEQTICDAIKPGHDWVKIGMDPARALPVIQQYTTAKLITPAQIPAELNNGPVMVTINNPNGTTHEVVATSCVTPNKFRIYDPGTGKKSTINDSQISKIWSPIAVTQQKNP